MEVRRFALALIALALVLATVFWFRPNVASYNGLRLLLNLSPVLVFTALAQMFVMTASDIDLGIGSFVALVNAIVAGILSDHTVLAVVMLLGCVVSYALMGALIHWRRLPSIVVTLGASFVWLGLALMVLPLPGGNVPSWLTGLVRFRPPGIPFPVILAVVPMVLAHLILNKMSYGVVLRGIGGSPSAVERAGRSTLRARMTLYALAGHLRRRGRDLPGGDHHHRRCQCGARPHLAFHRRGHHRRRRVRRRNRLAHRHGAGRAGDAALGLASELCLRGTRLAIQRAGRHPAGDPGASRRVLEASPQMISPGSAKLLAQPWFYASAGAIIVWLVIVAHSQGAGGGAVLSAALNYSVFFAIVGLGQMLVMASGAGNIDLSIPANITLGRLSLHRARWSAPIAG